MKKILYASFFVLLSIMLIVVLNQTLTETNHTINTTIMITNNNGILVDEGTYQINQLALETNSTTISSGFGAFFGVFMIENFFLNLLIWIFMTIVIAIFSFVIGKSFIRFFTKVKLKRKKRLKEKEETDSNEYQSNEKFERNVSACDYRKWSK